MNIDSTHVAWRIAAIQDAARSVIVKGRYDDDFFDDMQYVVDQVNELVYDLGVQDQVKHARVVLAEDRKRS